MKRYLGILLGLLFIISVFAAPQHLVIFHVNDTHGNVWPFDVYGDPDIGGFARIATVINEARAEVESEGGDVLFLHAGDVNTGVPESDLLDAVPDFATLHYMGTDAMVLGNHEFDVDLDTLKMQSRVAGFPFISANFVDRNLFPIFKPYVVKDLGEYSVGILGLTTEQTNVLEPLYLENNSIESAYYAVKEYMPELEEKTDIQIVLGHLGYYEEGKEPRLPVGYTSSNEIAEDFSNIEVLIDGHSHTLFEEAKVLNSTILSSSGDLGKYLGRIDLWIENGRIVDWDSQQIKIDSSIKEDPFIKMVADTYKEMGAEELDKEVGTTEVTLNGEREDVRSGETNLGHLITDALLWKTDADVALQNGGGIRASISEGKITYRDILTVLPFGNTAYTVKLKGSDLKAVADYAATIPDGQGSKLHVAGMTFKIEDEKAMNIKVNGVPLEMDKTYDVVTNNYMASGGDGYEMLEDKNGYDTGYVVADVVVGYIKELGTIEEYEKAERIIGD
ncbi:MAG: 5'-nucleotidase C-terminal domain-containing protein [Thermotogota bacterium]